MNPAEKEKLKDNLRGMIAGRGDGIDLDTPSQWIVEGIQQPEPFFNNLSLLLPADAILYFEGCSIAPDVAAFQETHRARNAVAVVRDTIFPVPDAYHVSFTPEVVTRLREFAGSYSRQNLFDHIKAYRGELLLFTFHDAFEGWLLISEHISESVVTEFCRSLGVTSRKEQTKKRDMEQLRRFLHVLENPKKGRKRLWRRLSGR